MNHLLFYDGQCGLCDFAVQFVCQHDKEGRFVFAPLQGSTADRMLKSLPLELRTQDSLILIENYQTPEQHIAVLGKGAFRVLWLLGGHWRLLGWPAFLPSFLYDWAYRLLAKNRYRLFRGWSCNLPGSNPSSRFLP